MTPTELSTIGDYELVEPIGRGGMGFVHRARHRATGLQVALKTVIVPDPDLVSGIRREIQALSRLDHPGIVPIVDQGLCEGIPWYAMELIEGVTLAAWTGRGTGLTAAGAWWTTRLLEDLPAPSSTKTYTTRPWREVITLYRRLCSPLAYLHGEGMVHRDLKPQNVLVRHDDTPILLDFGLMSRFGTSRARLAPTQGAAGTVAYVSPEQARGDPVDCRADIFSLGCMLFEALTGTPAFAGASVAEILEMRFHSDAPAVSTLRPDLPEELVRLLADMLARDPRIRIGFVEDVADALGRLGASNGFGASVPVRLHLFRSDLHGRSSQMEALKRTVARIWQGKGSMTLVAGESGVGKTRLLSDLGARALSRRTMVLTGNIDPNASAPLQGLAEPLRAIVDFCRPLPASEQDRIFSDAGPVLAEFEPTIRNLESQRDRPAPAPLRTGPATMRLFRSLTNLFCRLSGLYPLLLMIDDLQWADELTMGFLFHLHRSGATLSHSLVAICAYRSEEATPAIIELSNRPGIEQLRLARLDRQAVSLMVTDMLALRQPADELVSALAVQSEGNPFFVSEYLRTAAAQGIVARSGGRFRIVGELAGLALPRSIEALVSQRLDAQSSDARQLVAAAAILGREGREEILRELVSLPDERFIGAIGELLRAEVLEEHIPGRLRFRHDKLREGALSLLRRRDQQSLHRLAASLLVKQAPEESSEIARHWLAGRRPRRARPWLLRAGRQAAAVHALQEAETHLRTYLKCFRRLTATKVRGQIELAELLSRQGKISDASRLLERALIGARKLESSPLEIDALTNLGSVRRMLGRTRSSSRRYRQALARARLHRDRRREGGVLTSLANLEQQRGRLAIARRLYLEAMAIHQETGNRGALARTEQNLALLLDRLGDPEAAKPLYRRALTYARRARKRSLESSILANLGILHHARGELQEARPYYERSLAIDRLIGDPIAEATTLGNLATIFKDQGEPDQARELYERSLAICRDAEDLRGIGIAIGNIGAVYSDMGRLEEAERCFREALDIAREIDNRMGVAHYTLSLSNVLRDRGRLGEARDLAKAAADKLRTIGQRQAEAAALQSIGMIERLLYRYDDAEATLAMARAILEETSNAYSLTWNRLEEAHLALARGQEVDDSLLTDFPDATGRLKDDLDRLRAAIDRHQAGGLLLAGEDPDVVPEGLRTVLANPAHNTRST